MNRCISLVLSSASIVAGALPAGAGRPVGASAEGWTVTEEKRTPSSSMCPKR